MARRETTVRPPRGGRTPRRLSARAACVVIAGLAVLIVAPAAEAATASPASAASGQIVLADPAPSPSPQSTTPGIGLGPGAPTGGPSAPSPITTAGPSAGAESDPSWYDIPGQINKAINDWFASLVAGALTPMLNLLGATLLGTPDVTVMSGVTRIWGQMALLANALYVLIVLAGAVIVTTHGTVQSRFSAKEVVPRLAVGMIAGNASLGLIALMIHLANAIASAILGNTISPATAGAALGHQLSTEATGGGGIFLILLLLGGVVMLAAILLTYIVRVAITVVLAVAAPLALSMHALPGADSFARMWWRAMTGCLLIQLGQTLTFVVALEVMLDPNANVSILGLPNNNAWVDPLVFIALCWILVKIPFWVSRSMMGGGGSRLWSMAKTVVAYQALGALGMAKGRGPGGLPIHRKTGQSPNRPGQSPGGGGGGPRRGPGPGRGPAPDWSQAAARSEPGPRKASRRRGRPDWSTAQAVAGQGPQLAADQRSTSLATAADGGEGARVQAGRHHQMPIPFPGGGRKQLEARATAGDARLACNAMSRAEQPGTWLEEREVQRRRLARSAGARENPAPVAGPRFRQEALFSRSPTRMNPAPSPAPASGPSAASTPAPGPKARPAHRAPNPAMRTPLGPATGTPLGPTGAPSPTTARPVGTPHLARDRSAPPAASPRAAAQPAPPTASKPTRNSTR